MVFGRRPMAGIMDMLVALRLLHAPRPAASLDDQEVVRRVLGGDTVLFEVLMRRNNQRLYRAVRSVLRDEREVEDVMQHTYVRAFEHLSQFKGEAAFSTWLTRIGVNEALKRVRAPGLSAVPAGDAEGEVQMTEPGPDPERTAGARELVALLETALDELPQIYRTVFLLREVEGLSSKEAAACLEISEEALKVRLHRARALLRGHILEAAGEVAGSVFPFEAPRCDRLVGGVLAALADGGPAAG